MDIIHGIQNYSSPSKSILTTGTFDGVHIGHQKIINTLVKDAKQKKLRANLLTFFPHPRMILKSDKTSFSPYERARSARDRISAIFGGTYLAAFLWFF